DPHGGVRIETDVGTVFAAGFFSHPDDHAADHVAVFHLRIRSGFLDAGGNYIAQTRAQAEIAAAWQNTRQLACAAVIGNLENGSHSDHGRISSGGLLGRLSFTLLFRYPLLRPCLDPDR